MDKASIIRPFAPVRDKPKPTAEQHTQALFADPVDVVERKDGWVRVQLADQLITELVVGVQGKDPRAEYLRQPKIPLACIIHK